MIFLTAQQYKFLIKCTATDPSKPVLACVHFGTKGYAYSTDGHRVAAVRLHAEMEKPLTFHRDVLKAHIKGIKKGGRVVECPTAAIDSAYPDLSPLIPRSYASEVQFTPAQRNQITKALSDPDFTGLPNVVASIDTRGIRHTEGLGDRWLPALSQPWAGVDPIKVEGALPPLLSLSLCYTDLLSKFVWDTIKTNGKSDPVVFENSVTKDFYLLMPTRLSDKAKDMLRRG
jgi:hypothetical protein